MQTKFHKDMHYRLVENDAANDLIVYLHGLGDSGLCFEKLMKSSKLSEWNHVALDFIGYGKSLWSSEEVSLAEHANLVKKWILDFKRDSQRVFLVGHSMGGVIGLLLAEARSELFSGFVNIEGNLSIEDCLYSSKATIYAKNEFVERGFEQLKASLFEISFADSATRQYYVNLSLCNPAAFYDNAEELVELSTREQLAPKMAALTIPKLFIAAKPNGICDRSRMLLTASGVKTASVARSGHWPFLDNEALFLTIFRKFLLSQNTLTENI